MHQLLVALGPLAASVQVPVQLVDLLLALRGAAAWLLGETGEFFVVLLVQ